LGINFQHWKNFQNIPDGVVVKDGNEILPESDVFSYQSGEGKGSYSAFSNFFRYKLLLDKGGWWVDTDMVCLKPFDFELEHVFATESYMGKDQVTSGIIKAPIGSSAIKYAWEACCSKDPNKIIWGEVGPRLVGEIVNKFSLERYVQTHEKFCPLGFEKWMQVLNPNIDFQPNENSFAIHLWNEMWRRNQLDKNGTYHSFCFYEKLKQKFL